MTTARDLYLLIALIALAGVGALTAFLLRARIGRLLTRREWIVLGKIVGIVLFLFLLLLMKLARDFPAEMFIYGRF
jgi:hypothetical protein